MKIPLIQWRHYFKAFGRPITIFTIRSALAALLIASGCWRSYSVWQLYLDNPDLLRSGPSQFGWLEPILSALSTAWPGAAALFIGIALLRRRARGISALLCTSLILYDAYGVSQALHSSPTLLDLYLFETDADAAVLAHSIFLVLSVATLISLLWHENRAQLFIAASGPTEQSSESNWREWLLESLRDTGVQSPPDRFFIGVLTFLGIVILVIVGKFTPLPQTPDIALNIAIAIVWLLFGVLVLLPLFLRLVRSNWRSRARSAEEELLRPGSRRPVLYLRSFSLDDIASRTRPTLLEFILQRPLPNAEQELATAMRKCGPVIAIGRPDEKLPALGAARFYVSHARWQEKVSDIVKVSQLVVWATGVSEGLRWELSHLIKSLPPEKLILWAHPHVLNLGEKEREAEWQRFHALLGNLFPHPLPNVLGEARFIHFNDAFEPLLAKPSGFGSPLRSALHQLFIEKGLPKPDPVASSYRRRRLGVLLGVIIALVVLGSIMIALSHNN